MTQILQKFAVQPVVRFPNSDMNDRLSICLSLFKYRSIIYVSGILGSLLEYINIWHCICWFCFL